MSCKSGLYTLQVNLSAILIAVLVFTVSCKSSPPMAEPGDDSVARTAKPAGDTDSTTRLIKPAVVDSKTEQKRAKRGVVWNEPISFTGDEFTIKIIYDNGEPGAVETLQLLFERVNKKDGKGLFEKNKLPFQSSVNIIIGKKDYSNKITRASTLTASSLRGPGAEAKDNEYICDLLWYEVGDHLPTGQVTFTFTLATVDPEFLLYFSPVAVRIIRTSR